ncbi:LuxR family transcriptional regulator [Rhodococcus sp. KBW08]|uniref:helix-turn-helix transcriptional regulator n=1 Tax=Rhodococcus sp. KBW08 TaxID=2144188 RepID=UPI000F590B3B|nr:LuxR C-terminal-related transcriptional regulator [Rhodococcus sp. KBW08]RQO44745.1 LuxR family transcriptional regulator [Rhodococcus sp. KBW08]
MDRDNPPKLFNYCGARKQKGSALMFGMDGHDWAAIPERRTLSTSIPRQALFSKLDRRAALTIVRAPNGHGKSSLIASWLRAHLASERILVWVSAPQPSSTLEDFWAIVLDRIHAAGIALPDIDDLADPFTAVAKSLNALSRPVLLVLIRPDLTAEPELDDQLIELLTLCHNLDLVVTLSGFGMFSEPYLLDTDHEVISASELLFTTADTAHVLEQAGVQPTDGDSEQITSLTGGLPALVRVAVPAVRVSGTGTGTGNRGQMIKKNIVRAIDDYVNNSVLTTAEHVKQLEFLLATAFARSITVDIAAMLFESQRPDAAETVHQIRARLAILETSGLLSRVETEAEETWELPPAIRRSILARHTHAGIDPAQRLSFLAHNRLDNGHHASALDYAVEAKNWTLAVDIVEQHWVTMIVHNLDSVRSALQRIPMEAADKHSAVEAGRALFTMHPSERSAVVDLLPESPTELWELGSEAGAKDALSIACVQSIMLRMAGEYGLAAETTRRLSHLSRSALENNPEAVSAQLPLMRLQWAINFQLSGRLTESTIKARMAYHGALSHGVDFIARNSAGSAALNWALAGEPRQAAYWFELEQKHPDPGGWLEPVVKIAGLTARVLEALDTLDFDDARGTLTELGLPSDTEELWAFVVYAHCQFALTSGDRTSALLLLHNAIEAHSMQYTATSFALPLMQSAEIDLLLALGEGNKAAALAKEIIDPATNPWTLTSVARLRQRIGQNEAAVALCHQFDWSGESYPRAQMESLLVQAVAHSELGEPRLAAQEWSRACSIADQTGLLRSFATIASADVEKLESMAKTNSPALAEFAKKRPAESFPEIVRIVELTEREQKVLSLLALGMGSAAMADKLYVSVNTVKTQLRTLYKKLDAHNRNEAITKARQLRLL